LLPKDCHFDRNQQKMLMHEKIRYGYGAHHKVYRPTKSIIRKKKNRKLAITLRKERAQSGVDVCCT